jgi:hypothetical protein
LYYNCTACQFRFDGRTLEGIEQEIKLASRANGSHSAFASRATVYTSVLLLLVRALP